MVDKIKVENLSCFYSGKQVLKNLSLTVEKNEILSIIGPSNSGKTSFLRTLNRMNDLVDGVKITGNIEIDGEDIYSKGLDTTLLRKKVGMVFQQPNPFPKAPRAFCLNRCLKA